jgi:hypothetical protein
MKTVCTIGIALALSMSLAACVTGAPGNASAVVLPGVRAKVIRAEGIPDAVVVGKSTKADILAAFGPTQVIAFESGFEVWVYHLADDTKQARRGTNSELVILFAPTGHVAKSRIRPV